MCGVVSRLGVHNSQWKEWKNDAYTYELHCVNVFIKYNINNTSTTTTRHTPTHHGDDSVLFIKRRFKWGHIICDSKLRCIRHDPIHDHVLHAYLLHIIMFDTLEVYNIITNQFAQDHKQNT